jgi:hypothetical protein
VRKVQVSTHFDELDILHASPSTPEPPGIDDGLIKEISPEGSKNIKEAAAMEARSAVYATGTVTPPPELNTLVPEDFNLVDFNLKDLNGKAHENEIIKTDHHFVVEEEDQKPSTKAENKTEEVVEPAKKETSDTIVPTAVVVSSDPVNSVKEVFSSPKSVQKDEVTSKSETSAIAVDSQPSETDKTLTVLLPTESLASKNEAAIAETIGAKENTSDKPVEALILKDKEKIIERPLSKVAEARKSFEGGLIGQEDKVSKEPVVKSHTDTATKTIEDGKASTVEDSILKKQDPKLAVVTKEPPFNEVSETKAPPPLPTDTGHLIAIRDSMKPSLLPVKPVNGPPSVDTTEAISGKSSPLAKSEINAEELQSLRKQLEQQKYALEMEIDSKKNLELQIQAIISKSDAQEEALKLKNESMELVNAEFLKVNDDLTVIRGEKEKLEQSLARAEDELSKTSETNAKAYLEKSDEINALKDKLAEFAAIIGQKDKEIQSLQKQLDESKKINMNVALEEVQEYDEIEDELIKLVEEEIKKMQETIEEQRKYNAKLQMEVDGEYSFWKRALNGGDEAIKE